jgi:hypothetical protein
MDIGESTNTTINENSSAVLEMLHTHRGMGWQTDRQTDFDSCSTNKQTLWPLVRKRSTPTGRPPLVDEI